MPTRKKTMQAVVVVAPGQVELREVPRSVPDAGEVLIETLAAGICATDLEMIAGWDRSIYPAIPGHEWCGRVAEIGPDVDPSWLGRPVVGDNIITCGQCSVCRQGRWNACPEAKEVGFQLPGAYGEYLVTRADHLIHLPDEQSITTAALIEPLAVAVHGMSKLNVRPGDRCVVLGDGPLGLLCLQLADLAGGRDVILVGGHERRLTVGRALGADECINYHEVGDALADAILDLHGATDHVVDATGNVRAVETAITCLGQGGRLLVMGDYRDDRAAIRVLTLVHKNLEIVGANASPGTWHRAVELAGSGQVQLGPLLTHQFSRAQFADAIELVRSKRDGVIKAAFVNQPR
ncbi:MAG: alcohol dehydrogenase catalytic domain-containing protein [Phycisphaerae bacterium]|nr:alcohol dehydrogenase catalytic domain-containing protein [Phycisphaerae bacterium]